MKRIISISEILGLFAEGQEEFEVCATADAEYDEATAQLHMDLDSFIRPVDVTGKERHLPAAWLPKKEHLKESVDRTDASGLAREIFHRWTGRVRQSIPTLIHN